MPDNPRPQVPAADQTLRILSLLARQPGPMAAQSIATTLHIPRSSVYHLLATLEQHLSQAAVRPAFVVLHR